MGLDDLQARQRRASLWAHYRDSLSATMRANFPVLGDMVKAKATLELTTVSQHIPMCVSSESGMALDNYEQRPLLDLAVVGLPSERVAVFHLKMCSFTQQPSGLFLSKSSNILEGCYSITAQVAAEKPWIPLSITRKGKSRYIWWRGPEDNEKLAGAIVDALLDKERPSDPGIVEKLSRRPLGCALLLLPVAFAAFLRH